VTHPVSRIKGDMLALDAVRRILAADSQCLQLFSVLKTVKKSAVLSEPCGPMVWCGSPFL